MTFVVIPVTFASTLVNRLAKEKLLTASIANAIDIVTDEVDKLEKDQEHCSWNAKKREVRGEQK